MSTQSPSPRPSLQPLTITTTTTPSTPPSPSTYNDLPPPTPFPLHNPSPTEERFPWSGPPVPKPVPGTYFSRPVTWYEYHGEVVLWEFFKFFEAPGRFVPELASWVPSVGDGGEGGREGREKWAELVAVWMFFGRWLESMRVAEEGTKNGGSSLGETHCRDVIDELLLAVRAVYGRWRKAVITRREEGGGDARLKAWVTKLDAFFEVDEGGNMKEPVTEGMHEPQDHVYPDDGGADPTFWRKELFAEWDVDLLKGLRRLRDEPEKVQREELPEDRTECAICYRAFFENGEGGDEVEIPVRLRGCGHVFGEECIKGWVLANTACPMCRMELPVVTAYS